MKSKAVQKKHESRSDCKDRDGGRPYCRVGAFVKPVVSQTTNIVETIKVV